MNGGGKTGEAGQGRRQETETQTASGSGGKELRVEEARNAQYGTQGRTERTGGRGNARKAGETHGDGSPEKRGTWSRFLGKQIHYRLMQFEKCTRSVYPKIFSWFFLGLWLLSGQVGF